MKKLFIALMVSVSLFSSSLFAQIVTTKQSLGITEKPSVEAVLASKELEEKLTSLGIEKNIIKDRIARLTPNELQDLNDKPEQDSPDHSLFRIAGQQGQDKRRQCHERILWLEQKKRV